jgi:hypothetical protein
MDPAGIDLLTARATRDVAAEVSLARKMLEDARSELDLAVAALPNPDGDAAMATPALLTLLVGAVRAKEHLTKLEILLAGDRG